MTAPPVLNYAAEPPGGRLLCRRDGDDLIVILPPQPLLRAIAARLNWTLFGALLALTVLTFLLLNGGPPQWFALIVVYFIMFIAAVQFVAKCCTLAKLEMKLKLRHDRLWLEVTRPLQPDRRFLDVIGDADTGLQICNWPREEISRVYSRFGNLCIRPHRRNGRRSTSYIAGLSRAERRWLVETLRLKLNLSR